MSIWLGGGETSANSDATTITTAAVTGIKYAIGYRINYSKIQIKSLKKGCQAVGHMPRVIYFSWNLILYKFSMNTNIINMPIIHFINFDIKGHWRTHKVNKWKEVLVSSKF